MREIFHFNSGWYFSRQNVCGEAVLSFGTRVDLPHTWNAQDGQDGGNDYYRGNCWYAKKLVTPRLDGRQLWIEFEGAAMTAEVFLNGVKLCRHEGGYSTFRVNLTPNLKPEGKENLLCVSVDNGKNDRVYPQKADFTFYGGIYRNVNLIAVPENHFVLDHFGAPGIRVTPKLSEDLKTAHVTLEAFVTGGNTVTFTAAGQEVMVPVTEGKASAVITIENVRLWNGIADPFLYTAEAALDSGDTVSARFGCRTIGFDADKGFWLNGRNIRLCGAARHQDRQGLGNALTRQEHEEDIALLLDMGANTVRLAHYQHDQYFYDLCDEKGLIVWAEIPYISEHLPGGNENTVSQMTELIEQNYNHPSIVCWGLSNEITSSGMSEALKENHRVLNDLCHTLDSTRPTTMAHVFMLNSEDPFVQLPDIRSYNLYYGWYVGEPEQNDEWFDSYHAKHPDSVIGLSEYGADANPQYQNGKPEKGDWSEPYQAVYHEHMLKMWLERPYIWAMHCWNMFDFGADGRDEGGKPGQNQKGLVTFDRKIKKDAFFIYKAYLSKEPFVHVCGSRYVDRAEAETEVKVYSNLREVTLLVDGREFAAQEGDKVFTFRVPITGKHTITAVSGENSDTITIRHVESCNESYCKPGTQITNWFDREDEIVKEGFFSIKDSMGAVKANPEAAAVLNRLMAPLQAKIIEAYGDVAKNVEMPPEMQAMMDAMSVEASLKQMGQLVTPDLVHTLNGALNRVRK
ncbi:MAG: glycoside hydrolase family 2 protein [Faecousia sp.]